MEEKDLHELERRIEAIEHRNRQVELDKGWETSRTRKTILAALTFLAVVTYLKVTGSDKAFLSALIPVMGFLLSTLVLQTAKHQWEKRKHPDETETGRRGI